MEVSNNDKRIRFIDGVENDVLSRARKLFYFTKRPGVCKAVKRSYNKRLRKKFKQELRDN